MWCWEFEFSLRFKSTTILFLYCTQTSLFHFRIGRCNEKHILFLRKQIEIGWNIFSFCLSHIHLFWSVLLKTMMFSNTREKNNRMKKKEGISWKIYNWWKFFNGKVCRHIYRTRIEIDITTCSLICARFRM